MRIIPLVVVAVLATQTAGAVDYAALEVVNDQINQQIMANALPRSQPDESLSRRHAVGLEYSQPQYQYGQPVYRADQCIGAVVNGVCHGAVVPSAQSINPQRCYGQMLNGICTGPQF